MLFKNPTTSEGFLIWLFQVHGKHVIRSPQIEKNIENRVKSLLSLHFFLV